MKKLWKCPKCGRRFLKKNQVHSCNLYPVKKHFEGKDFAKTIYNHFKNQIKKHIGSFYVESLLCCIHFVTNAYTFAAVYALKDGIKIHFTLDHKLKNKRIDRFYQMSKNRYLFNIYIESKKEINKELIGWLKESYNLKK
jgi:predicted nucleic-acid-binding Zn-ribbon protein